MDDAWHKSEYERVMQSSGTKLRIPWEELQEHQKEGVRKANLANKEFMDKLGDAIRTGGPLPNPSNDNRGV